MGCKKMNMQERVFSVVKLKLLIMNSNAYHYQERTQRRLIQSALTRAGWAIKWRSSMGPSGDAAEKEMENRGRDGLREHLGNGTVSDSAYVMGVQRMLFFVLFDFDHELV